MSSRLGVSKSNTKPSLTRMLKDPFVSVKPANREGCVHLKYLFSCHKMPKNALN